MITNRKGFICNMYDHIPIHPTNRSYSYYFRRQMEDALPWWQAFYESAPRSLIVKNKILMEITPQYAIKDYLIYLNRYNRGIF